MAIGIYSYTLKCIRARTSEWVKLNYAFQLFAKKAQPPSTIIKMGRPNLQTVATDAKGAALKGLVVTTILLGDKISDNFALIVCFTLMQILGHSAVGFDRSNAIDTRNRGHNNYIITLQK